MYPYVLVSPTISSNRSVNHFSIFSLLSMRSSPSLLRTLHTPPASHSLPVQGLTYALGLSYAAKYSPPFVPPDTKPPHQGFAGQQNKVGKWVGEMLALRAGRGELQAGEGGWSEAVGAEARRWGAGEDFFAIIEGSGDTHIALADGVGGWAPRVDPALFSQALLYHYALAARFNPSASPASLLSSAFNSVQADPLVTAGSSTFCGLSFAPTGAARGVNLGDSGLTLLRGSATHWESAVQTHYFNCPLQLSKIPPKKPVSPEERTRIIQAIRALPRGAEIPPELQEAASSLMDDPIRDKPEDGDKFDLSLQPGDTVLLYTDGLSDNVPAEHIPQLEQVVESLLGQPANAHLSPAERASEKARILADVLVGYARGGMTRTGDEDGWKTPFEVEAEKAGVQGFKGGKIDDVTVITAVVTELI